jgi:hypothetical protein
MVRSVQEDRSSIPRRWIVTIVALRARYTELMRLRAFVKRIEDSSGDDDVDIKFEKTSSPMLPGALRVACVTRRRRPNL